jgi:hypothetical protein
MLSKWTLKVCTSQTENRDTSIERNFTFRKQYDMIIKGELFGGRAVGMEKG